MNEQERLEKAREKLLKMNQKVQHAQNISKKRTSVKASAVKEEKPAKQTNTYVFELTESMLIDGFDENEVVKYVELVETEAKSTSLDLDQREIQIQAELKKINRAIDRIRNPKVAESPEPGKVKKAKEVPKDEEKVPSSPGYAELHAARMNPKNEVKKAAVASTPKKSVKKEAKSKPGETPAVQATGAGAKFLADLVNDPFDNNDWGV